MNSGLARDVGTSTDPQTPVTQFRCFPHWRLFRNPLWAVRLFPWLSLSFWLPSGGWYSQTEKQLRGEKKSCDPGLCQLPSLVPPFPPRKAVHGVHSHRSCRLALHTPQARAVWATGAKAFCLSRWPSSCAPGPQVHFHWLELLLACASSKCLVACLYFLLDSLIWAVVLWFQLASHKGSTFDLILLIISSLITFLWSSSKSYL